MKGLNMVRYRRSVAELKKRVLSLINEYDHPSARFIAEKMKVSPGTVYRVVRLLREENIGILPGKGGYIMAEDATVQDDTHFMRRAVSSYTSNKLILNGARKYIIERWHKLPQYKDVKLIVGAFEVGETEMKESLSKLES